MPFYNFEVRTATHVLVTDGTELADGAAAQVEAAKRIGELLNKHAGQVWTDENWQMDVTDHTGLI